MNDNNPKSVEAALELLRSLGAPPRLVRHGEIIADVAEMISSALHALGIEHDAPLVIAGASLHDAGKIMHPEELEGPGHEHEVAGERLLLEHGLSPALARCCRSHGRWDAEDVSLEERVVALADHIWKGTREEQLELLITDEVAHKMGIDRWHAFAKLDLVFDDIAASAIARLAKARL